MDFLDILRQYANPAAVPAAQVNEHFDAVAQQAPQQSMGSAVAAALRSNATPPFAETIGSLFANSNPQQRAGVLNELMQSLGPAALSTVGGGFLGQLLGSNSASGGITAAQSQQVTPQQVTQLAQSAERQDASVIDRLGGFYAQHPTLVKSLGVAALGVLMSHLHQQQQ